MHDIVVIGGGMAGISAAAWLSAKADVAVIEAEPQIGYHATGRSAAMLIRNYGGDVARALNDLATPWFTSSEHDPPLLSPRGEMMIADKTRLPDLAAYAKGAVGLDHLTTQEALEICPILRPESAAAAIIERGACAIDVDMMLGRLAAKFRNAGGQIITNARVTALARQAGHWRIETTSGVVEAAIIVNAAGAWADELAVMARAAPLGLTALRRSAAILPAPSGIDVTHWPMIVPVQEGWYMKPDSGRLMVSPADTDPQPPHDAWVDDMVLAEGLDRFTQATTYTLERVEARWAGLRTFAPDFAPVVGFDMDAEGFFWLAGQGGTGIQTAPALAALSADLLLGRPPEMDAATRAALHPTRFA